MTKKQNGAIDIGQVHVRPDTPAETLVAWRAEAEKELSRLETRIARIEAEIKAIPAHRADLAAKLRSADDDLDLLGAYAAHRAEQGALQDMAEDLRKPWREIRDKLQAIKNQQQRNESAVIRAALAAEAEAARQAEADAERQRNYESARARGLDRGENPRDWPETWQEKEAARKAPSH